MEHYNFAQLALELCAEKGADYNAPIGKGAFKETFQIAIKGKSFALKIVDPTKVNVERYKIEVKALSCCRSDRISQLHEYGTFSNSGSSFFYLIEEYIGGGTLTDRLKSGHLPVVEARTFALSIIEAIDCLKQNRMVHRDIKPDNIMYRLNDPLPILVDLGLVRDLSAVSLTPSFIAHGPGTPFFSAPEQLNNEKQLIDWKSDQFSLGVVLAFALTGRHPFQLDGETPYDTINRVIKRDVCAPWFSDYAKVNRITPLLKMIEPWPIRRFTDIHELEMSFSCMEDK